MGVSIFNTATRDQLLQYAKTLSDAGVSAENAAERGAVLTGPVTKTHTALSAYICFSAVDSCIINIPFGVLESLSVYDADRKWNLQPLVLRWLDDVGGVAHEEVINDKNGSYTAFETDGIWYLNKTGNGRCDVLFTI